MMNYRWSLCRQREKQREWRERGFTAAYLNLFIPRLRQQRRLEDGYIIHGHAIIIAVQCGAVMMAPL